MRNNKNYLELANEVELLKRQLQDSREENKSMRRFMLHLQEENNQLRKQKGSNVDSSQPRKALK